MGSLDANHMEYCSGVCCQNAFKFNNLIAHKLEGAEVVHFCKTLSLPVTDAAIVTKVLCMGCGTCVAACPAAAMTGVHFTNDQIFAEIEQVLS